jgi:hypothetical protein
MPEQSEHQRITAAGWAYRTNNRGWVIYRDPQTALWRTRSEASLIIIQAQDSRQTGPRRGGQIPGAMASVAPDYQPPPRPPAAI